MADSTNQPCHCYWCSLSCMLNNHMQFLDFGNDLTCVGNDCSGYNGCNGDPEYPTKCGLCCQPCNVSGHCGGVLCAHHTCFLGSQWRQEPTDEGGVDHYGGFCIQWHHAYEASWGACSLFLKDRSFCGLLLPNVPGFGYSWLSAWSSPFTCITEHVRSAIKVRARGEARESPIYILADLIENHVRLTFVGFRGLECILNPPPSPLEEKQISTLEYC
nr:predicted protein [Ipomoea batatas]